MSNNSQPVTLEISGMSCGHCVAAVKSALNAAPGVAVQDVTVGSATVKLESQTSPAIALAAVREAGYEARVASSSADTTRRSS